MSTVPSHQSVRLARGRHASPDDGVCVMELASMLGGEPFTDRPRCVCRVIAALLRTCNDRFDDAVRQRLYGYAAASVGSNGGRELEQRRIEACVAAIAHQPPIGGGWGWSRPLKPSRGSGDRELEIFAHRVVRAMRKRGGAAALLRLVDDLLALELEGPQVTAAPADDRHACMAR